MKYCSHCGKELSDDAVICVECGCSVSEQNTQTANNASVDGTVLLNTLSQRLNINGIIWLVIGILQILGGIFLNWLLLISGVLNIIFAVKDMQYSKALLEKPAGIVGKFESVTEPIIMLIYNLFIGGVISVIGSIYYFISVRNYVMENKTFFASLDSNN